MEISVELMNRVLLIFDSLNLKYKQCGFIENQPFQHTIKNPNSLKDAEFNVFTKVNMFRKDDEVDKSYIKLDKIIGTYVDIVMIFKQVNIDNSQIKIFENNGFKIEIIEKTNEYYYYEFVGYIFIDDFLNKMKINNMEPVIYYDDLEKDIYKIPKLLTSIRKKEINKLKNDIKDSIKVLCKDYYSNQHKSFYNAETYFNKFNKKINKTKNNWKFKSLYGNYYEHTYENHTIDYSVRVLIYMKLFLITKNKNIIPSFVTIRDCNFAINENGLLNKINSFIIDKSCGLLNSRNEFFEEIKNINNTIEPTFSFDELVEIIRNSNILESEYRKKKKKNKKEKINEIQNQLSSFF